MPIMGVSLDQTEAAVTAAINAYFNGLEAAAEAADAVLALVENWPSESIPEQPEEAENY
jgi:predicted RNA polymerase sigma factor